MKYSKFISIGTAIAICASTSIISNSWFTNTTERQNIILLDNQYIIPGSGYYTRKVNTYSDSKKLDVYLKSTWSGLDDPYVTRIWNYDNPSESGNYFVSIENTLVNSSKFNNAAASFILNDKDKFRMTLNKKYSSLFSSNSFNEQEYFARLLVAVGSEDGNEIKEYIEIGLKVRTRLPGAIWEDKVQAQWHIINRSTSKWELTPFAKTLEEEEEKLPEIELPDEDNQENEADKPNIGSPEVPGNQPNNPDDGSIVPPLDSPNDEEEETEEVESPETTDPPVTVPEVDADILKVLPEY